METYTQGKETDLQPEFIAARKASWNIEGVEPGNQEGPG